MSKPIETERLLLRGITDEDDDFIIAMHQNPQVTEFLYGDWTLEFIHMWMGFMKTRTQNSLHIWVIEEKISRKPIGFIGMDSPDWQASFTPCTEIGWRLLPQYWGKGYASEAAKAIIQFAFIELNLDEIVSFTAKANRNSMGVMEKIGMRRDEEHDFLHPEIPAEHPLAENVLYRIKRN
jgi:RimJ/RimL family protein N-acetyltransferase